MTLLGSSDASRASGADILTADVSPSVGRELLKVLIRVATATAVSMTVDSTNFYPINNNVALVADRWYNFEFPVSSSDTINFNQSTGTMVINIRVLQT